MDSAAEIEKQTLDNFRDKLSTIDSSGKRVWIYPTKPKGNFYTLRSYITVLYLIIFFGLPFIKVHGEPLFLFNVVERKFILFGTIFWPQDFFIFGLGMLIFIIFIALFTVIYGRVFCGFACPQTIFMEMLFRKIEYWIDGDANYQKALAKEPLHMKKIMKRILKYKLFFILSFIIASTFLAYIISIDSVLEMFMNPSENTSGILSLIIFTSVFFFIYSWFREQVCLIVCPYGRMQGVLLDKNSMLVAYDYLRGEPRYKFKKNETNTGDCIDCNLCVKVCPTGIDIRNGTQMECINCTACIDACDNIMKKVNRPKGLIRFDSENGIKNKVKFLFTSRMKAYTAVLCLLIGIEVFLLATRSDYDATVLRAKGMLFQEQPNNQVSNLYTIKLVNKTRDSFPVTIKVENMDATIKIVGKDIMVKKEAVTEGTFFVMLDKADITKRKTKLRLALYSNYKKIKTVKTNFLGPVTVNIN
jgi:cytochrome c oxidase accessory protein FixG